MKNKGVRDSGGFIGLSNTISGLPRIDNIEENVLTEEDLEEIKKREKGLREKIATMQSNDLMRKN